MSFSGEFEKTAALGALARGGMALGKGLWNAGKGIGKGVGKGVASIPKGVSTTAKGIVKAPGAAYKGLKSVAKHTKDFGSGFLGVGFLAADGVGNMKSMSQAMNRGLGMPKTASSPTTLHAAVTRQRGDHGENS